jgi:hypothetical protein
MQTSNLIILKPELCEAGCKFSKKSSGALNVRCFPTYITWRISRQAYEYKDYYEGI